LIRARWKFVVGIAGDLGKMVSPGPRGRFCARGEPVDDASLISKLDTQFQRPGVVSGELDQTLSVQRTPDVHSWLGRRELDLLDDPGGIFLLDSTARHQCVLCARR